MVLGPKDIEEERERERPRERERESKEVKWEEFLTLACGDVAVSPVDPVFMVGDVAPGLHIPIRVPAEVRVSPHQPTSTWGVLLTDSLRGGGGGIFPVGSIKATVEHWLKFQREIILTVSIIHHPGGSACSWFYSSSSSAGTTISSSLMGASLFRGQMQKKDTGQLFCL